MSASDDRWWEGDGDLGLDLAAERAAPAPDPEARARVLAGVMAHIGPGGPPGGESAPGPPPSPASPATVTPASVTTAAGGSAVGWGLAIVLAVGGGAWVMGTPAAPPAHAPATTPSVAAAPTPIRPTPSGQPTSTALDAHPRPVMALERSARPAQAAVTPASTAPDVGPHPARRAGIRPHPAAPRSAAPRPPSDLAREQALLSAARAALQRGDEAAAARAIDAHRRQFAHGQLVEAREVLHIQRLVREGRRPAARAATEAFRVRFPNSLLGPALEDALQTPPEADR